jgi:tetratricopeptide (TPR) repeat protein
MKTRAISFLLILIIVCSPFQLASAQPKMEFKFSKDDKAIAHYNIGLNYAKNNRLKDAIREFEISLQLNPDNPDAYYNMGVAYSKLEEPELAVKCYERVIVAKPDDPYTYYNLAVALSAMDNLEKAKLNYEKAVELKDDFVEAYANLAMIYHFNNNIDQYRAILVKLDKLDPAIATQVRQATSPQKNISAP